MDVQPFNPLIAQLTHQPFPEVANTLRSQVDQITHAWVEAVREAMPQMRHLTFDEIKDSTPTILHAIADALASVDPETIHELERRAPKQGLSRLELNFDVIEVMQEDRLLRSITIQHVEAALLRRMDSAESAAMHAAIDIMLQGSVIALVEKQKSQLRATVETKRKVLHFLSHDMTNNLSAVSVWLEVLALQLKRTGEFPNAESSLASARDAIYAANAGMQKMLDHEGIHGVSEPYLFTRVDLQAVAQHLVERENALDFAIPIVATHGDRDALGSDRSRGSGAATE